MNYPQGIFNLQQIPGDTDFDDVPVVSDDERETEIPSDAVPSIVPVDEPPTENTPPEINENPKHAPRIMHAAANNENRIY